jgi:A/G-specific adenine glycosylase
MSNTKRKFMTVGSPSSATPLSTEIAAPLLQWFARFGRKHLPWQQSRTAYRVWISEIMLQQTQVTTVIPYFLRFMDRLPSVTALAAAPLDEVLHLWTGLGYYARARNLHRAAQCIVNEHGGEFPSQFEQVQALPGIGRSTAGAILALSGEQRHPILDGNVKRVLARYFGVDGFPGEKPIESRLWQLAEQATPHTRVADYTQGIMDLGATVCTRSRPACDDCPLAADCVARNEGRQHQLPAPRPKRVRPQRDAYVLIMQRSDRSVLLEKRPMHGIWGGLWTFPQFETRQSASEWLALHASTDIASEQHEEWPPYSHAFTHFDLTIRPIRVQFELLSVRDTDRYLWFHLQRPAAVGLAKPAVDLIAACFSEARVQSHLFVA